MKRIFVGGPLHGQLREVDAGATAVLHRAPSAAHHYALRHVYRYDPPPAARFPVMVWDLHPDTGEEIDAAILADALAAVLLQTLPELQDGGKSEARSSKYVRSQRAATNSKPE